LEHVILRGVLRASRQQARETVVVEAGHLSLSPVQSSRPEPRRARHVTVPLREAVDAFTARALEEAVVNADGNWSEAARRLGVQRGNLHRLARRLGLK
jgi:anaerobic nitric oxide reductase transcription regulator